MQLELPTFFPSEPFFFLIDSSLACVPLGPVHSTRLDWGPFSRIAIVIFFLFLTLIRAYISRIQP